MENREDDHGLLIDAIVSPEISYPQTIESRVKSGHFLDPGFYRQKGGGRKVSLYLFKNGRPLFFSERLKISVGLFLKLDPEFPGAHSAFSRFTISESSSPPSLR